MRSDVEPLVALRDEAARWLLEQGIVQWRPGEFTHDRMRSWVEAGHMYVLRQGNELLASVGVLWQDPEIWGEPPVPAGYIHLLIVHRRCRGSGLGGQVLSWAERHIQGNGRSVARLDAVSTNETLHRWYQRRGYVEVGCHTFEDPQWFPVVLREKLLTC